MEETVKKRGRPPKPDAVRKRKNLTFRVRDELLETLTAQAASNQRSISEEIEARLERLNVLDKEEKKISAETAALLAFIRSSVLLLEGLSGETIASPEVAKACDGAIKLILHRLTKSLPDGDISENAFDAGLSAAALLLDAPDPEGKMEGHIKQFVRFSEARKLGQRLTDIQDKAKEP